MDDPVDPNRSVWAATAIAAPELPPLPGDGTADVVVIGAGFTGLSTAWHLSARFPERRVVVLEAGQVGAGASGRNGGLMLNWVNGVHLDEPEGTRRVFAATRDGIDGIERLIVGEGLPVRYRRDGALEVYTRADRAEAAHARVETLRSWGIPVEYLHGAALDARLRLRGAVGAVYDPTAGQLHGLDLLRAMVPLLLARGVAIHERSAVTRIVEGPTIAVETARGTLRAGAIVLATNGYTGALGYFRDRVFPLHSHVIATAPLSAAEREAVGWGAVAGFNDDLDRIAYGSMTTDGELVFGGGSNASYGYRFGNQTTWPGSPDTARAGFAAVEATFAKYFPDAASRPIAHRWTGTLGITFSRVCTMGVRGEHQNVYYALGYSGHGVTLANLAGRVLTDLYAGTPDAWRGLPFFGRQLPWIPGEPLRWLGYQAVTRLTGKSPRRVDYG